MADDPLGQLSKAYVIDLSADIEAQLSTMNGCQPIAHMLLLARRDAAAALTQLAVCDLNTPINEIRNLQNEIARYDNLIRWMREIVDEGIRYDAEVKREDLDEIANAIHTNPEVERELRELGINTREFNDA